MRTIGGQFLLVLVALLVFSIFFYYSKKRIFYNNREFIFLYGLFLATIMLGSLGYHRVSYVCGTGIVFHIIVNILIGSRSALYLLLSSTLLISYYAPNSYMFAFMQVTAGIVAIFSLSHLQRRSQLILSIFLIFITYTLVYMAFILTQEGEIRGTHLFALIWLAINCLLLTLTYPVIYIFERIFGYTSESH